MRASVHAKSVSRMPMVKKGGNNRAMEDLTVIKQLLEEVSDPEIPVINIVDLGIVKSYRWIEDEKVSVVITPTYSACPAMYTIKEDIESVFAKNGIRAEVETVLFPAWTTELISEKGRANLLAYGIAPPNEVKAGDFFGRPRACPQCGSTKTKLLSNFGSTLCKANYQCEECLEPFDYFKCHQ